MELKKCVVDPVLLSLMWGRVYRDADEYIPERPILMLDEWGKIQEAIRAISVGVCSITFVI